jgi:hypothetical protein
MFLYQSKLSLADLNELSQDIKSDFLSKCQMACLVFLKLPFS